MSKTQKHNGQFAAMPGKRIRLNVFQKLKVRSSIKVYHKKFATVASWKVLIGNTTTE